MRGGNTVSKLHLIIERQDELVICKLDKTHKWFFTACYRGVRELLGFNFPKGSSWEFDFEATNITERR